MNKASEVKNKLKKITDKNQIRNMFKDKGSVIDLLLDFKSGEYRGVRIERKFDGEHIEVDTSNSWIINKDEPSEWAKLDKAMKNALDSYTLAHFDYDDIDKEDFKSLNKGIKKDLDDEYKKSSKDILEKIRKDLEEIKNKDYSRDLIKKFVKKFDKVRKKNSYNLFYSEDFVDVKISSKKEYIKIKNHYSYEKKISMDDFVEGFDLRKIESYLEERRKKKEYNDKMMAIEDSFDRSSVHTSASTISSDKRDLDTDRIEREEKKES